MNDPMPSITDQIEIAADLTHIESRNYSFWMYEVLPRFRLLNESGIKGDQYIEGYEPEHVPFQEETYKKLGIDKVFRTYNEFLAKVEKLILPSQPDFLTKWDMIFSAMPFLDWNRCRHRTSESIFGEKEHDEF
ncbi:glycosyltransferase 61 family protein [Neobacillus terrae]|uniref:glycosyltransferase 61 family protein n=1 Tax=Neobacillus terrae TaxID=3034837 RepID=UPI001409F4E1|nr:glycosyltransferase 61 family protein [Neobacillus terrae]NHM31134.1 glycosyltransferase family 61 protein [Neobacillus terrae]